MAEAKLNSELIAIVAGDITVFNYDGETREYLHPLNIWLLALACQPTPALMRREKAKKISPFAGQRILPPGNTSPITVVKRCTALKQANR
jgi:hypothetical protein